MLDIFFFYTFAILVLMGALATILMRNPVHSAVGLTASLAGVAGIFLLQGAEFLSVAQVIVYIGGIMVLFLFVIMLVNIGRAGRERRFGKNAKWAATAACVVSAAILSILSGRPLQLAPPLPGNAFDNASGNTEQIGTALFTNFLLPFEIASVLLLAALVGAIVMARKRT
ncbi:MAG: NADH-quinone oxidoreductase subunit J [Acidobacteriota bacterium]|nr:NADH-quinone oxidoreductase subunit J [Acidobacteriota bacterium]